MYRSLFSLAVGFPREIGGMRGWVLCLPKASCLGKVYVSYQRLHN